MAAKKKLPSTVSCPGIAAYAWLNKADTAYKEEGEYKLTLIAENNDVTKAYLAKLDEMSVESAKINEVKLTKKHKKPYELYEHDAEDERSKEEWDGKYVIKATSRYKPGCFNRKKEDLETLGMFIMSGDEVRFSSMVNAYEGLGTGYNLRIKNVQLITKNNNGSSGNEFDDDFDDEEASDAADKDDF